MKTIDLLVKYWIILHHPIWWFKGRTMFFLSKIRGEKGNNLHIKQSVVKKSEISFAGSKHKIAMTGCEVFNCTVFLRGKGHQLIVEEGVRLFNMNIKIIGSENTVYIGKRTSMGGGNLISGGNQISIKVGDNCMIAEGVDIWSSDTHSVLRDGVLENEPKSITIGNHVWCGKDVAILKGVTIGDNAVIGMRSLVTKDIRPGTLNVGSPAKEIRDGIEWTRINPNNASL